MAKSTISPETKSLLINGALIAGGVYVAYNYVIKPLSNKLGVLSDENIQAGTTLSAWNPQFSATAPAGSLLLTTAAGQALAKKIKGAFTVFQDDYATILAAIKTCKTQSQVSSLCYHFKNLYGMDMYNYMIDPGGILPWDGLSNAHLTELNTYVSNLPKYKV